MEIYINGRFLTQSVTGVQRYACEVVKRIDRLLSEDEYKNIKVILITPQNIKYKIDVENIIIKKSGRLAGHLWEQFELPLFVGRKMLINLCNVGPVFKKNQLVTIHDAAVFAERDAFSSIFGFIYRLIYRSECFFSKNIVTVSEFSKIELSKYISIKESKIHVFHEGKEHIEHKNSDFTIFKEKHLERPYLLAVGSMDPRKNFKNLVLAFQEIRNNPFDIVVAGGTNPKVFRDSNTDFPSNVKYLGYVSDEQLKALYERAYCFIFPSFYEGFGLPPLEAMACGCPVITSNTSSLVEVCEDAALYCNPYDVNDISEKINYLIQNEAKRNEMKCLGKVHASHFSWSHCARKIINLAIK